MDKQINELAKDIYSMIRSDSMSRALASMLYGEGYRKASEVIEEMAILFKGIIEFDIALTDEETNYLCERIDEIVEEMLEDTK